MYIQVLWKGVPMRTCGLKENLGKTLRSGLKQHLKLTVSGYCAISQSGQIQMNVNEVFGYPLSQGRCSACAPNHGHLRQNIPMKVC